MTKDRTENLALPPEERVETAFGTVCLAYIDADKVRVASGRDVGWFRMDGVKLYATALLRRVDEEWIIHPRHSAVTTVSDDRVADNVEPEVRDVAFKVLADTFRDWSETRPDIPARIELVTRRAEEYRAEDRLADLLEEAARLRKELPALREARAEAEAEVERVVSMMDSSPKP